MSATHSTTTLHPEDLPRLASLRERVRRYMVGHGDWKTLRDIQQNCGGSEAGCSARLRDLRHPEFGGLTVEHRRLDTGVWEYRITEGQGRLW